MPLDLGSDRSASDGVSCSGVLSPTNSQSYQIDVEHRLKGPSDSMQLRPDLLLQRHRLVTGIPLLFPADLDMANKSISKKCGSYNNDEVFLDELRNLRAQKTRN